MLSISRSPVLHFHPSPIHHHPAFRCSLGETSLHPWLNPEIKVCPHHARPFPPTQATFQWNPMPCVRISFNRNCQPIYLSHFPPLHIVSSLSNEFAVHLMLFNSIEIMSRRYLNEEIYYKIACFDMNQMMETSLPVTSPVVIDEESLGVGDEYSVQIGVMNNNEHKFHSQEQFGRLLQKNEFVMFRARTPATEHIVSVHLPSRYSRFWCKWHFLGYSSGSFQKDQNCRTEWNRARVYFWEDCLLLHLPTRCKGK